jgi:DNA-binding MarR family transcriptional regulator
MCSTKIAYNQSKPNVAVRYDQLNAAKKRIMVTESDLWGWITAANTRKEILYALYDGRLTPNQIITARRLEKSQVSKYLHQLVHRNLVKLDNPGTRKGRLYSITSLGHQMVDELFDLESGRTGVCPICRREIDETRHRYQKR